MVNRVILIGRLGKNPEIKFLDSGNAVTNFSVACSEKWTDKSGEKKEKTEWFRIQAWGKLAEICDKYLQKGSLAYIEGKLSTRQWQDKDGQTKYSTEVVAENVRFLSKSDNSQNEGLAPDAGMFG